MATQYFVKQGRKFMSYLRLERDATEEAAIRPAYQLSTNLSIEPQSDSTMTKDGNVNIQSGNETTVEISYLLSDDPTTDLIYEAVRENLLVEHWLVDLSQPVEKGGYAARYMQGYFQGFELPADAEGGVEISGELSINGDPVDGVVTLTEEDIANIQYVFRDLSVWNEEVEEGT